MPGTDAGLGDDGTLVVGDKRFKMADNSKDFTDQEVASAIPYASWEAVVKYIQQESKCCDQPFLRCRYEVRRRKPHVYFRLTQTCGAGHQKVILIRADWLPCEATE